MERRFEKRVAIVTGAASGMGAAIAERLAAEGATVLVTDVQEEKGRQVAAGCGAEFRRLDVADKARWDALIEEIEQRHGRLDVLVNNAGMLGKGSIEDVDLAAWDRTIGVNLTGVMLGCHAAIGLMKRNRDPDGGAIVNTSSTAAFGAIADDIAYTASKSGVRMLSKAIAVHCARKGYKIRCNSLHPGAVSTAIHDGIRETAGNEAIDDFLANMSPLGRVGTPAEIAAFVAFLCSDEAQFLTASEYLADGGCLAPHPLV